MWQIYGDKELIYDSRYQDLMITQGEFNLEVNHSGSFTFALYRASPVLHARGIGHDHHRIQKR